MKLHYGVQDTFLLIFPEHLAKRLLDSLHLAKTSFTSVLILFLSPPTGF